MESLMPDEISEFVKLFQVIYLRQMDVMAEEPGTDQFSNIDLFIGVCWNISFLENLFDIYNIFNLSLVSPYVALQQERLICEEENNISL